MVLSGEKTLTDNKNRRMFEITLKKKVKARVTAGKENLWKSI
jgi:hypothetical protein